MERPRSRRSRAPSSTSSRPPSSCRRAALAILILWERFLTPRGRIFQLIQGPLVAVVFGIAYQLITARFAPGWSLSAEHLVQVPVAESLSDLGSLFVQPDWSQLRQPLIYSTAAVLAVIASLETLLCVEATDKLDPHKRVTPTNRELLAQGAGNVASGLLGGLPVTQVIVRSSANIQSGGQTKLAAIFHGLLLLVFVFALPQILNLIPLAVLASILFVVGYKLAKPALFAAMYRLGWAQFAPFVVTIGGVILTDLLTGVLAGLAVSIGLILSRNYQNSHFVHVDRPDEGAGTTQIRLRLAEDVTFLHRGAVMRELSQVPDGAEVTIDLSRSVSVDHDVLEIIDDFEASAAERNLRVSILNRPEDPAETAAA